MQSYVDKKLKKDPLWLKQEEGTRTIHVPFDQIIQWGEDNALLTLINAAPPVWQMLATINQALDNTDPHYRLEAHLTSKGTEITAVEKYPGASVDKPINIKFTTLMPDTDKGRDLVEKLKLFIASGVPVKVPFSYVKNLELPEFIKQALPEFTEDGFVAFGPAQHPKPLLLRFEFTADDGEQFTLEYVHLKVVQAGREEITLTNDDQPIPIKVRVVLRADGTMSTDIGFTRTLNIHQLLLQLQLQSCLSKPHTAHLINLETGLIEANAKNRTEFFGAPSTWLLQAIEALEAFQRKARRQITLPDREFSNEEWKVLKQLRLIFREGKIEETWSHFSATLSLLPEDIPGVKQLIAPFEGGKTSELTLESEETVTLFDIDLPLGERRLTLIQAKLINEQYVKEKLAEQKESEIQLEFIPSDDPTAIREYLDWITDKV